MVLEFELFSSASKELTSRLMRLFVGDLPGRKYSFRPVINLDAPYEGTRKPTQLLLKQSCEQNELSFPSFRHVGHCRAPASFGQSVPRQGFFAGSGVAIVFIELETRRYETGRDGT